MNTRPLRGRIAAAAALLLVGSVILAAPAAADEHTLMVRIVPATELFMTDGATGITGVIEVFDATSDLTNAVVTVPFGVENPFVAPSIAVDLPPGAYKVRATADDFVPAWYQASPVTAGPESGLEDLPWLFGPRSDSSPEATSVITVGSDGVADHPSFSIMVHDSETSVAGILGTWATTGWSMTDRLVEDAVGFVELYEEGADEPLQTLEVTQGAAFVFRDVPLGTYELRAILGTSPGAEATWPHPELTASDLVDPVSRWYPAAAERGDGTAVTIDAQHPHWDGASIAMDDEPAASGFSGTVVTGDVYEGGTLFARLGEDQLGVPPHLFLVTGYEWRIDDQIVEGATGSSFVIPSGTAGSTVTATIFSLIAPAAIRGSGVSEPTTAITVSPLPLLTAPVPVVTGSALVGQKLTAEPGTWGPANVAKSWQWNRDGVPIPGATTKSYKVTVDDIEASLSITVTGTKPGYLTSSRTSEWTAAVPGLEFTTAPVPTVRGALRVGEELSVGSVGWRPVVDSLSYQWTRDAVAIPGATGPTYLLGPDDLGAGIGVGVVARKAGYATQSKVSAPTGAVGLGRIVAAKPPLLGTAQVGQVLSIDESSWRPSERAVVYRWQRDGYGAGGTAWRDIAGAVGPTYTLTAADAGKHVRLKVSITAPYYEDLARTSDPSGVVAGP